MKAITVAESVYVDGRWMDAQWEVQAVDGGSGELLITASAAGRDLVLRMDMELARDLRGQAGFDGPLPVDEARAELAYWRESVEFAVRLLAKGRAAGQNIVTQSGHAEEYLRGLLALDGMPPEVGAPEPCYDCRTTGERIDDLEALLEETTDLVGTLSARQRNDEVAFGDRLSEIERRMEELGHQVGLLQAEHVTPADVQRDRDWLTGLTMRVGALEAINGTANT